MDSRHSPALPTAGFSFVELLVVTALVSALVAALVPVAISLKNREKTSQAALAVRTIAEAVTTYHTDYGKYPEAYPDGTTPPQGQDVAVGDPEAHIENNNSNLFNILRNLDAPPNVNRVQNPRNIVYLDSAQVARIDVPRDGFMDMAAGPRQFLGCFFDPWGRQYNIVMDTNKDGQVDVGRFYSDFAPPKSPKIGVAVFSLGPDRALGIKGAGKYIDGGRKSDDLISWGE